MEGIGSLCRANASYEELEQNAAFHNALFKIIEFRNSTGNFFNSSADDARNMLIESVLRYCEITRLCGDSDDLLGALSKTGFLEQKYESTKHFQEVYPAVLTERAEILWTRHERIEAVQTLRSIIKSPQQNMSFWLVPRELVFAKLVKNSSSAQDLVNDFILGVVDIPNAS